MSGTAEALDQPACNKLPAEGVACVLAATVTVLVCRVSRAFAPKYGMNEMTSTHHKHTPDAVSNSVSLMKLRFGRGNMIIL